MISASVFITIQWIAIGLSFILFVYTKLQRPSEMQKYASMLSVGTMLMLFGYNLELQATTFESAYYATIFSYIGEPFMLISIFFLVSTFYDVKIPKWLFIVLVIFALSIPVLVYTNDYHHLYYDSVGFDPDAVYSSLVLDHGPLYYLNALISIVCVLLTTITIVRGYKTTKSVMKKRLSVYSFLMVFFGISGYIVYFLGLSGGYDTTMLGLSTVVVFLAILYFRCRAFDVVDRAKDYALDLSTDGIIIYDDADRIVYKNAAAEKILSNLIPEESLKDLAGGETVRKVDDVIYSIKETEITHRNDYLGRSIEISDISESYNYRSQLEKAVKATKEKLEGIQRTILGSFASLVEARSLETGDHIRRVSVYTEKIAKSLVKQGRYAELLTDEYVKMLVNSSPLHDIGKISISDTILLKPGKLTDEEFDEMKKHAAIGAEVIKVTMSGLESKEYVDMAADIALYHHERWDGKGYPCRLMGADIPLAARIVAVADCFDAMTSKRCYKDAFTDEQALEIIKEEAGTHFDPEVVKAFLDEMK